MRKSVNIFLAAAILIAWSIAAQAHTNDKGEKDCANCPNGAFSCQMAFDTSMSIDEVRKLLGKTFPATAEIQVFARAEMTSGDRKALKAWGDASLNWSRVMNSVGDTAYDKQMKASIQAALTKHFPNVWNRKVKDAQDLLRHYSILQEISALKADNLEYGLFRIQRLIQDRYEIEQYANCL